MAEFSSGDSRSRSAEVLRLVKRILRAQGASLHMIGFNENTFSPAIIVCFEQGSSAILGSFKCSDTAIRRPLAIGHQSEAV